MINVIDEFMEIAIDFKQKKFYLEFYLQSNHTNDPKLNR